MGSKKNAHRKKSTNRITKKRRQILKNLRKKYRGGEGEPEVEPDVKPSGFMSRINDFWNWITGKKDVPSPTNGEIPPLEEPIFETPEEEEPIFETPEEEPTLETPEEEPTLETPEEEPKLETPEEEPKLETPEEEPVRKLDEKASPFEKSVEETNENPFKKMGGKKKKTKQNRSTKKRRKQ
jgi:hypothetical protein